MKTENSPPAGPVWTRNVELSMTEECLPIIGSSQVSSILQNLDPISTNHENPQNMNLIIIPTSGLKLPRLETPSNLQSNYVVLKENSASEQLKPKLVVGSSVDKQMETYEDMLYFVCNLCPFLCTRDSKITEHLENAHKNKTVIKLPELKCPACQNIFYHKLSLRSHLIHDHGVGNSDLSQIIQAVIYYSNKTKSKMKEAKQKVQKKLPDIEKTVENSHFSVDTDHVYKEQLDDHSRTPPDKQESVSIALPQITEIPKNNIQKIHNFTVGQSISKSVDQKKFNKCTVPNCKVKLQDFEKMNYHISCHNGEGFKCTDCGEEFLFWKPLISHLWRLHKINMELYSCDKCEYKTYSLAKLNNIHKFIHGDAKNFICNLCNKAFKTSKQVRNHKLTHKDRAEKTVHSCEECSKTFGDKRQLRKHTDVVHKKLRPFLCNFCGYKGSSKSSLKMHVRQHTGEKPFSCSACSYTTSDHNSLRRHKLLHTGHKPYKCSYCTYACIQSTTYKTHLKTKHPGMEKDLMFTCHQCQFRSVNKDIYVMHMVTVHKMKLKDN